MSNQFFRFDSPRTSSVVAVLASLAALSVAVSPLACQEPTTRARTAYQDLQMFSQVLNQIRVNHPDSIDTHRLIMGAIEGMVRTADPHSYVLPYYRLPADLQEARDNEDLYPIPIEFAYQSGAPFVVSVHPGSKASELDILPGDELLAADGEKLAAESAPELTMVLSGRKNSTVALSLKRRRWDGSTVMLEREVRREKIEESSSVGASLMLDGQTGYLRLLHFGNEDLLGELREHISSLESAGMQGLVLDLRDNGGGLIEVAGRVAGEFLPRGEIVYTSEGRKSDVADTVRARSSSRSVGTEVPVVVLVNRGTASAAELVAGALQDHDRALIVGEPTFGKSAILRSFPMTDGSVIVLVIGHLKTPCGRVVQRRYQDVRASDYFREAGTVVDTAGRPYCKTRSGRVVYGGGGIYPDHLFESSDSELPNWLSELSERQLAVQWLGGYLSDTTFTFSSPEAMAETPLPDNVVDNFFGFASESGVSVPPEERDVVAELLLLRVAWALWGAQGYYTIAAKHDPRVEAAAAQLEEARRLLEGSH